MPGEREKTDPQRKKDEAKAQRDADTSEHVAPEEGRERERREDKEKGGGGSG